jgi:hypothetical protein
MRVAVPNTCPRSPLAQSLRAWGAAVVWSGRFEDAPLGLVLLPGDALGVDPEQHVHTVTCPLSDLRRGDPGVEPCGYGGVAEVVGAPGQERGCFCPAERCVSCLVEDREVGAVGESAATDADEHAAVWSGAVLLKVGAEQRDEFGVDGYWPGLPWCPVLEFAACAGRPLSVQCEPLRGSECVILPILVRGG